MVLRKLLLDQTMAAPLATTAFYTGLSFLEGKDDIMEDWREKFLNTYKTGLMFWPFVQFVNFSLVPLYVRTTFTGCCAFIWATFLCFSRQSGDGTAGAALAWMFAPKDLLIELTDDETGSKKEIVDSKEKHLQLKLAAADSGANPCTNGNDIKQGNCQHIEQRNRRDSMSSAQCTKQG